MRSPTASGPFSPDPPPAPQSSRLPICSSNCCWVGIRKKMRKVLAYFTLDNMPKVCIVETRVLPYQYTDRENPSRDRKGEAMSIKNKTVSQLVASGGRR